MGAIVTPPPHPDLVKRATDNYICTGVKADVECPSVSGRKGNCVVVSSTGQCCYETDIAKCARGGDCKDFTAGCGTGCCTEAFPYCNTEIVPNDAVYPRCEQTSNPIYTNSYYLNGNTPGIGVLTSRRSDPGQTDTIKPGSTSTRSTAPPSGTTTTSTGSDPEPLSGGAIAGIAIGGAAGLGALALGVFFLFFKKKPTAPAQSAAMAEYTQQQHLQQYVPQPMHSPGFAHGHDPSTPKPYPEQPLAEVPANETPIAGYRPPSELPANNH
ncbi:hypothetical protein HOY80DRAFT_892242 [Tuber brumale]|nr:hypothetical protein HOY80DRAFT_892242 [Tuber brumale]